MIKHSNDVRHPYAVKHPPHLIKHPIPLRYHNDVKHPPVITSQSLKNIPLSLYNIPIMDHISPCEKHPNNVNTSEKYYFEGKTFKLLKGTIEMFGVAADVLILVNIANAIIRRGHCVML